MSQKNLSATTKTLKEYKEKLLNKRINQLNNSFEESFDIKGNFAVAVSGGADSLALSFLTKLYSIKNNLTSKYFIVDHKLRKDSTAEAKKVKIILSKFSIKAEILTWKGKKPLKNIQSLARQKRYDLLFSKCKKLKIKNLVLGHHIDDMLENFFIRMLRGSGLKGLVSLGKKTQINNINLIRPLLNFQKKDLIFISKNIFNYFVKDPSNIDTKFKRIRIRNLIKELQNNGLDKNKFLLTIDNLKRSNKSISFYVEQNLKKNSFLNIKKNELILSNNFFDKPYEIVLRSLSDSIKTIGMKYNVTRGKKIDKIITQIRNNTLNKETLGNCVIKKVHQTVILTKEH
jgi:tRNA(Ile)-lysidine synthase